MAEEKTYMEKLAEKACGNHDVPAQTETKSTFHEEVEPTSPGAHIAELQEEAKVEDFYFTEDAVADIQLLISKIEGLPGSILAKGKLIGAIERLREGKREQEDDA